ncbi:putative ATP synthase F0, A subunit [Dictyocaulus viviparus]|uniref:Amino acid transporter n=1 Tax=Dictyocaulus viviparus TaxID=29172 RepID=A0A0D8Y375_DICVI|nr:putative ATP synthase F0, A subunit [Dictyocaulus viviparus]
MFPENIIQATFQQVQTYYVPIKPKLQRHNGTNNVSEVIIHKPQLTYTNEMNVLVTGSNKYNFYHCYYWNFSQYEYEEYNEIVDERAGDDRIFWPIYTNKYGLIVFCSGFGVILSILGDQARLMINFFIVLDAIIMRWISALMWCYPIGILSLVCKNIVDIDNLTETAQALAMYVVTVICGLMIHSLLTLPLLYFIVTRKSPFAYMTGMLQALATAFGTASSGATLPVTFRALEENLKIDRRVTRFVLPLGATITMVYFSGATLPVTFRALEENLKIDRRVTRFVLPLGATITMVIALNYLISLSQSVTTTVASIGSGSVPAGLDTIVIVLTTVGLPAKDLSLLLTVDWLLDRIRTSVNVLGDGFGAGIIHHLTRDSLVEADNDELIRQIREDIHHLNNPELNPPQLVTNHVSLQTAAQNQTYIPLQYYTVSVILFNLLTYI